MCYGYCGGGQCISYGPWREAWGHRGGSTVLILVVALVAVAAVAAGPVYYGAARTSILQDTVAGAPVIGRGFEANETGPVTSTLLSLRQTVNGLLDSDLGPKAAARLFAPPVQSIEGTGLYQPYGKEFILAWRTGSARICASPGPARPRPGR
jgi:hypothetical protein